MTDKPLEPLGATSVKPDPADPADSGFGQGKGYSGDEYDSAGHAAERHLENRDRAPATGGDDPANGRDVPPEAGKRASISDNGEVHGSGSDAGGYGNGGEDIDLDISRGG